MFSKKATSSPLIWHLLHNVKWKVKISSIFVAFLKNMNFNPIDVNDHFQKSLKILIEIQQLTLSSTFSTSRVPLVRMGYSIWTLWIRRAKKNNNVWSPKVKSLTSERHLWQPNFSKGLTKLAVILDYKHPGTIFLALPAHRKVLKLDFQSEFYMSKIIRIFLIFFHWGIRFLEHIFC